ncbi:hypothetical protein Tco_0886365 [Tanacetum coccineum]
MRVQGVADSDMSSTARRDGMKIHTGAFVKEKNFTLGAYAVFLILKGLTLRASIRSLALEFFSCRPCLRIGDPRAFCGALLFMLGKLEFIARFGVKLVNLLNQEVMWRGTVDELGGS